MKLLIISQKVDADDDNLGFFCYWLEKFASRLKQVYAVGLSGGKHNLPKNVTVYSLGKEKGYSKPRQLFLLQKFLFKNLSKADGVFVHMAPIFAVLSFPLAKIFNKKLILWYAHGSVTLLLKLAEKCVDKILTASPESCRLKNRVKIEVIGHGIDTNLFKPSPKNNTQLKDKHFIILAPGRISPSKNQKTIVEAIDVLVNKMNIKDIKLQFVGSPLEYYEKEYYQQLKKIVEEKRLGDYIEFLGSILYRDMPKCYQNSDLVLNASFTGSIDKVVLEAMASGNLVLTCNEAYAPILDKKYMFKRKEPRELAEKISNLKGAARDENLREIVVKNHNLDNLIKKITQCFIQC